MLPNSALLLIDLQCAVDDSSWGARNNPQAEANVVRLLTLWREMQMPIFHVRHDSTDPSSTYRPGQNGHAFKSEARPRDGETVIAKQTNSAFIGTNLEAQLRTNGIAALVIVGVSTNNSVEATVRLAGNLGFATYLVEDAAFAFEKKDWRGRLRSAEEVHDMSLANLDGEYCSVVKTDWVLRTMATRSS